VKNRFVIFTRDDCPYCVKAKQLLDSENWGYFVWNISENEFAKEFLKQSGFTTVPQVYFNGRHVGGYEALENFLALN
jgi:glutaredoxin